MSPGFAEAREVAEDTAELVRLLVQRRRDHGLSQTEVAARMGTSQSAVARLESGEADVRISTLQRYASALDTQLRFAIRDHGSQQL